MCTSQIKTPRFVRIHNPWLGILCRLCQTVVILYVVFYGLWFQKGYQVGLNGRIFECDKREISSLVILKKMRVITVETNQPNLLKELISFSNQ